MDWHGTRSAILMMWTDLFNTIKCALHGPAGEGIDNEGVGGLERRGGGGWVRLPNYSYAHDTGVSSYCR